MKLQRGRAGLTLLWTTVWLAGMGTIVYWCVNRHIPAIEQQIQQNVQAAIAPIASTAIDVDVQGRTAFLSGSLDNPEQIQGIVAAAISAEGVSKIVNNMAIAGLTNIKTVSTDLPATTIVDTDANATEADSAAAEPLFVQEDTSEENGIMSTDVVPLIDLAAGALNTESTVSEEAIEAESVVTEPVMSDTAESTTVELVMPDTAAADEPTTLDTTDAEPTAAEPAMPDTAGVETVAIEATTPDTIDIEPAAQESVNTETLNSASLTRINEAETAKEVSELEQNSSAEPDGIIESAPDDADATTDALMTTGPSVEQTDTATQPSALETITADNTPVLNEEPSIAEPVAAAKQPAPEAEAEAIAPTQPPFLKLHIVSGDTLTLSGNMSTNDNVLSLIETAMNNFDTDYVVNTINLDADFKEAAWLQAISEFLPVFSSLDNAGIDIVESQVSLAGIAQSESEHRKIIDAALAVFGDYSLVERIQVNKDSTNEAVQNNQSTSNSTSDQPESVLPQETTQATVAPKVEKKSPKVDTTTPLLAPVLSAETSDQAKDSVYTVSADESNNDSPSSIDKLSLEIEFAALDDTKILFEVGSNILTSQSYLAIENIANLIQRYPDIHVDIDGHTDSSGNPKVNLSLSQARANAVRDVLVKYGIAPERLTANGFGDAIPIADNKTAAGRRLNRRIEFNF